MLDLTISTLLFIPALIIILWLHRQYHLDIRVDPTASQPTKAPLISILVPARNEERNLRLCLDSLLAQTYPNFEAIVVDDCSTDATPDILQEYAARSARLQIVHGRELPAGWAGKPHALYQASRLAHGEWLCFIDADTRLAPQALSACYLKAFETGADLFTIMTRQIMASFWEKTVLPIVMTALSVGFSPRKVNDPRRRDAIANGQFILIKRSVYTAVGGHERIKEQIVEDKAISEQVKWHGYRLVIADGMQVARTHMYTSLPEMWEGWTKNIYLGLHDQPSLFWLGVLGALLSLIAAVFLPVWPLAGLLWLLQSGSWMAAAIVVQALLVWAVLLCARLQVARRSGITGWYALTTPVGAGVFAAMMVSSAWKVLSGRGVTWRGRRYNPPR